MNNQVKMTTISGGNKWWTTNLEEVGDESQGAPRGGDVSSLYHQNHLATINNDFVNAAAATSVNETVTVINAAATVNNAAATVVNHAAAAVINAAATVFNAAATVVNAAATVNNDAATVDNTAAAVVNDAATIVNAAAPDMDAAATVVAAADTVDNDAAAIVIYHAAVVIIVAGMVGGAVPPPCTKYSIDNKVFLQVQQCFWATVGNHEKKNPVKLDLKGAQVWDFRSLRFPLFSRHENRSG